MPHNIYKPFGEKQKNCSLIFGMPFQSSMDQKKMFIKSIEDKIYKPPKEVRRPVEEIDQGWIELITDPTFADGIHEFRAGQSRPDGWNSYDYYGNNVDITISNGTAYLTHLIRSVGLDLMYYRAIPELAGKTIYKRVVSCYQKRHGDHFPARGRNADGGLEITLGGLIGQVEEGTITFESDAEFVYNGTDRFRFYLWEGSMKLLDVRNPSMKIYYR